jgi:hypothetical protein
LSRGRLSRRALLLGAAGGLGGLALGRAAAPQPPPPPPRPAPPAPAPGEIPRTAPGEAPRTAPAPRPGTPAPSGVAAELRATLARAIERFEAKDLDGVLAHLSDAYWTGPFTKRTVRAQLLTMFQVNQEVRARVRIDEVRLVDGHAWVWSTGALSGLLPFVPQWVELFAWQRELEVARREGSAWRLYGYQQ